MQEYFREEGELGLGWLHVVLGISARAQPAGTRVMSVAIVAGLASCLPVHPADRAVLTIEAELPVAILQLCPGEVVRSVTFTAYPNAPADAGSVGKGGVQLWRVNSVAEGKALPKVILGDVPEGFTEVARPRKDVERTGILQVTARTNAGPQRALGHFEELEEGLVEWLGPDKISVSKFRAQAQGEIVGCRPPSAS